jgi:hypothetical protein
MMFGRGIARRCLPPEPLYKELSPEQLELAKALQVPPDLLYGSTATDVDVSGPPVATTEPYYMDELAWFDMGCKVGVDWACKGCDKTAVFVQPGYDHAKVDRALTELNKTRAEVIAGKVHMDEEDARKWREFYEDPAPK